MASETAAPNHSSEEVEKELKPEVKIMEPVQVCPPKESVDRPEPEQVPAPVATFVESGAKVEETKTEPIVTENVKEIDADKNLKAEESEQKNENKQVEVPPGEEGKKIEDACDDNNAEVGKVSHPEPDINSVPKESIVEKIEAEPEEKLDTKTVEKQEESKVEPSVVEKLCEPEKVVEVSKQLPTKAAARQYIGNVEVLPDKEMEESEAELTEVETTEEKKDGVPKESIVEKIKGKPEEKLDTETVEKQEETKVEPSIVEKLGEPEKVIEVSKQLPAQAAAKEYIGNVEVLPDKEREESEAELAKVETAEEKKDGIPNESVVQKIEGEPEEKLDTETVEKQEESNVEPSVVEKPSEPEKVVEVSKQLPTKAAAKVYIGNVEVLPDKEMEESEAELAKVETAEEKKDNVQKESIVEKIEGESEEKLDTETVEKQEESKVEPSVVKKLGEPEKVVEVSERLPAKAAAKEYIGNVEVLPDKEMEESEAELAKVETAEEKKDEQVEASEEKEVKDAEGKPEEISETEPAEKLEQSAVEFVEEKPEEPGETLQVPLQSSVDPVERKVEKLEELPIKEVEAIVEKEGTFSEAEPPEKQEEFKVEPVDEKVNEPTKTAEPSSVEAIEENVDKKLPAKEVEETAVKEVDVSETEIKPEEISETNRFESVEKISVQPVKIVDKPEQSYAEEKVVELPAKDVEADVKKEVIVSESECKPKEILDADPSEKLEESKVGLAEEKPDEPKEIVEAVEEEDKSMEKAEELPANIVEEIQEATDKEAKVSEVESKPEEISEKKPIGSVEEKSVGPEKIVDVPVQTSVLKTSGEVEELPAKEMEATVDKELEEIPETEPAEKLEESEVALVEKKPDESIKIVDVQEQSSVEINKDKVEKGVELPTEKVEAISEKENEVPKVEFKHEEISETEPAEESKLKLVEEDLNESTKIVDIPEQPVEEVVEEKVGSMEELPAKEADATAEDAVKVSEDESKPEEINETKPVETIEKKPVEPEKIVDLAEQSSVEAVKEKLERVEELPAKEVEAPVEKEAKIIEAGLKPEEISVSTPEEKLVEQSEVTEQSEKEPPAAEPLEKEAKVSEAELKPEEISLSTPEEKLAKQCEVTEQSEKEPPAAEPVEKETKVLEVELKPEEISESTREEKPIELSEVIEQSKKEPPAAEPVEQSKMEALADKVDKTELSNKEELTILETGGEEVSEKTDAPNEQMESVKETVEIDPLPDEKVVNSGKTELETEVQEEKCVTTRELPPCEEAKPTESEATEKLVKEDVTSRDIELSAENGYRPKDEAEVKGNRDEEATKEAEKSEPVTQIENVGRSLKEKLEQEKRDDETTKTDVQTETTNESEDTKAAAEDASKDEGSVKTTQKQSNNIMKMVKHSLVKAKKAIIGKSANSKAPVSETKCEEVSK